MRFELDLKIEQGITAKAIVSYQSDVDGSYVDWIKISEIKYHPHSGMTDPIDLAFYHIGGDITEADWEAKVLEALEFEAQDYFDSEWPATGFNEYYGFWSRIKHRNLPDAA